MAIARVRPGPPDAVRLARAAGAGAAVRDGRGLPPLAGPVRPGLGRARPTCSRSTACRCRRSWRTRREARSACTGRRTSRSSGSSASARAVARSARWARWLERLEREALATADLVVAVSAADRDTFVARYGDGRRRRSPWSRTASTPRASARADAGREAGRARGAGPGRRRARAASSSAPTSSTTAAPSRTCSATSCRALPAPGGAAVDRRRRERELPGARRARGRRPRARGARAERPVARGCGAATWASTRSRPAPARTSSCRPTWPAGLDVVTTPFGARGFERLAAYVTPADDRRLRRRDRVAAPAGRDAHGARRRARLVRVERAGGAPARGVRRRPRAARARPGARDEDPRRPQVRLGQGRRRDVPVRARAAARRGGTRGRARSPCTIRATGRTPWSRFFVSRSSSAAAATGWPTWAAPRASSTGARRARRWPRCWPRRRPTSRTCTTSRTSCRRRSSTRWPRAACRSCRRSTTTSCCARSTPSARRARCASDAAAARYWHAAGAALQRRLAAAVGDEHGRGLRARLARLVRSRARLPLPQPVRARQDARVRRGARAPGVRAALRRRRGVHAGARRRRLRLLRRAPGRGEGRAPRCWPRTPPRPGSSW